MSHPTQKTVSNGGKLGPRDVAFPKEKHTNLFSSDKWLTLKTCIHLALYRPNRLYQKHTHMFINNISEIRAHEFEGEKEGHMGGLRGRKGN